MNVRIYFRLEVQLFLTFKKTFQENVFSMLFEEYTAVTDHKFSWVNFSENPV